MLLTKHKRVTALFAILALIYLAQATLISPSQATLDKYGISESQASLLSAAVALPYVAIWVMALMGYLRLKTYSRLIKRSKDGEAFMTISNGLLVLALWLPLTAIISGLGTHYYNSHPGATPEVVIVENYLNLAILFPALFLINYGAKKLVTIIKSPVKSPDIMILAYIAFSSLYTWLVLSDPNRTTPTEAVESATYHLPDWLILTTIVIPRLVMWFFGLQAAYYIYLYAKKVKGSLYRRALRNLAIGLTGTVIFVITLRAISSLSVQFNNLGLGSVLILIFLLLILVGVGFVFIAKGARQLQLIEEA